jgi:hypothetical protein
MRATRGQRRKAKPTEITSKEPGWRNAMIIQKPLRKQWLLLPELLVIVE